MLERDFDLVVIGRNDLSLLFALEQLQRSQSVLILNDGGPQEGGHRRMLGPLEHHFLKAWGDAKKIPPLQNLEDYLHPHPLHVFFNGRWVRFGARPSLNMLELFRHFGELFGPSFSLHREFTGARGRAFDQAMVRLGRILGHRAFRKEGLEFDLDFFLSECPVFFEKFFYEIRDYFHKHPFSDQRPVYVLAFLLKAFFFKNLSLEMNDGDLFSMFINMLGPLYGPDQDRLVRDLTDFFIREGGVVKDTKVKEWKFHKNSPWCLELDSFERVVHPEKLAFFSERLDGVPLRPRNREGIHEDLIFENFVPLENSGSFPCGHFIFGDLTRLGTSFPLWWLEALKKTSDHLHLKAHVLSLRDCAFTGPHFQQTIIAHIEKDLACVDPWVAKKLGPWSVSCGPDLYGPLSSLKKCPSEDLVDYSTPLPGRRMKKMFYFPTSMNSLGRLGTLMAIRPAPVV